jgi:hypothetical protein
LDRKRFKDGKSESWTIVYTDGFCKDNDKKDAIRKAGLGVYFPREDIKISKSIDKTLENNNTNTRTFSG